MKRDSVGAGEKRPLLHEGGRYSSESIGRRKVRDMSGVGALYEARGAKGPGESP